MGDDDREGRSNMMREEWERVCVCLVSDARHFNRKQAKKEEKVIITAAINAAPDLTLLERTITKDSGQKKVLTVPTRKRTMSTNYTR